jgi:hypothetical protein
VPPRRGPHDDGEEEGRCAAEHDGQQRDRYEECPLHGPSLLRFRASCPDGEKAKAA